MTNWMKYRRGWITRTAVIMLLLALGYRDWVAMHGVLGMNIVSASANCSVEQMSPNAIPLQLQLLPGEKVELGDLQLSREEAIRLLKGIQTTRAGKTLLLDADDSLSLQDVVSMFSDARAVLPNWSIFVVTPQTRDASRKLVRSRAVPTT